MRAREEIKIAGLNAVLAVAKHRPEDVVRVYLVEERLRELGPLLEQLAAAKKAYHIVEEDELERVADTVHHEGVCALVKKKKTVAFGDLLARIGDGPATLVLLENVRNPHNLGAILRIAAHFGVRAVIASGAEEFSPALYRTAEGGAEAVDVVRTDEPARALAALQKRGFRAYATSSHARESLWETRFAERVVIVLGAEAEGVSDAVFNLADEVVAIEGTGDVESLNVASAAAVLLAERWRTFRPSPRATPRGGRAKTRGSRSR